MLKNITAKETKDGKAYYQFSLMVGVRELPLESIGWRYYPDSGKVKPPQTQHKGRWFNTFKGFEQEQEACVRGMVERYLGTHEVEETPSRGSEGQESGSQMKPLTKETLEHMADVLLNTAYPEYDGDWLTSKLKDGMLTEDEYKRVIELVPGS